MDGCTRGVQDYTKAKVGSGASITDPRSPIEGFDDVLP